MKLPKLAAALLAASLLTGSAFAMKPVTIVDQGSFLAGGTIVTAPGNYKGSTEPTNNAGETLHGDHAYVFYQKPKNAHHNSLVFLHGYGQSAKTWETTPDGRDGFQNIFLWKKAIRRISSMNRAAAVPAGRPSLRRLVPVRTTSCGTTISASANGLIIMLMPPFPGMKLRGTSSSGL